MMHPLPNPADLMSEIKYFLEDSEYYMEKTKIKSSISWYLLTEGDYVDLKAIWRQAVLKIDPIYKKFNTSYSISGFKKIKTENKKMFRGIDLVHVPESNGDRKTSLFSAVERHRRIEASVFSRNQKLSAICKKNAKYRCQACEFKFSEKYQKIGVKFIEAHHLRPLSLRKSIRPTNQNDLVALCSNCHSMIHELIRINGCDVPLEEFRSYITKGNP